MQPDVVCSPVVGKYRGPMDSSTPFYAARIHNLRNEMVSNPEVLQILIMYFDELMWININPCDIVEWQGRKPFGPFKIRNHQLC